MQTKHWNTLSTSFTNRLQKMRVFSVLFKIACVIFFLNESFSCLQEYLHQETVSVSVLGGQETYGIPRICFAFSGFTLWDIQFIILQIYFLSIGFLTNELFDKTSNREDSLLSFKQYQRGNWSNELFSADDLYYRVTPDVSDLLYKIVVKKLLTKEGDDYEKKSFHFIQGVLNNHTELSFTRKDYYTALRNYCILLRYYILFASFHSLV